MTLKRVLLFSGALGVAFILGWVIVPTVFLKKAPQQPVRTVDLSYEHSCETDLMRTPDTDVEYISGSNRDSPTDDLVWTGRFRSDQIPYKSGETWLGLFREGSKYSIHKAKLILAKAKEPGIAEIEVNTDRSGRSLFLVRNMPYLREGEITTVWDEETTEQPLMPLTAGPRTFELTGKSYTLSVEAQQDGRLVKGSKLVLTTGKDRQTLRTLSTDCTDCVWTVSWAGDLDRDGKLDFLIDLPDKPNTTEKVLFLSSQPVGGKLVKSVASFGLSLTD